MAPPIAPLSAKLKAAIAERDEILARMEVDKAREMELRKFITAQLFPDPKEGANVRIMPGLEVKMEHKIERKVDAPLFLSQRPALLKYGIPCDALVKMNPSLVLKEYRLLTAQKRKHFDRVLTITDAAPRLLINA